MQRWRGGETARVSQCHGVPDLEVTVAASLFIVCAGEKNVQQPLQVEAEKGKFPGVWNAWSRNQSAEDRFEASLK